MVDDNNNDNNNNDIPEKDPSGTISNQKAQDMASGLSSLTRKMPDLSIRTSIDAALSRSKIIEKQTLKQTQEYQARLKQIKDKLALAEEYVALQTLEEKQAHSFHKEMTDRTKGAAHKELSELKKIRAGTKTQEEKLGHHIAQAELLQQAHAEEYLRTSVERLTEPEAVQTEIVKARSKLEVIAKSYITGATPGYSPNIQEAKALRHITSIDQALSKRIAEVPSDERNIKIDKLRKERGRWVAEAATAQLTRKQQEKLGVSEDQLMQIAMQDYLEAPTGEIRAARKVRVSELLGGRVTKERAKELQEKIQLQRSEAFAQYREEVDKIGARTDISEEEKKRDQAKALTDFTKSIEEPTKVFNELAAVVKDYIEVEKKRKEELQKVAAWMGAGGAVIGGAAKVGRAFSYGIGLESEQLQTQYLGVANQQIGDYRKMFQGDMGASLRIMKDFYGQALSRGAEIRGYEKVAQIAERGGDLAKGAAQTIGAYTSGGAAAAVGAGANAVAGSAVDIGRAYEGTPQAEAALRGAKTRLAYLSELTAPEVSLMQKARDATVGTVQSFSGFGYEKLGDFNANRFINKMATEGFLSPEAAQSAVAAATTSLGAYANRPDIEAAAIRGGRLQASGIMSAQAYATMYGQFTSQTGGISESNFKELLSKAIKDGFDGSATAGALLQSSRVIGQIAGGTSALSGMNIQEQAAEAVAAAMKAAKESGVEKGVRGEAAAMYLSDYQKYGSQSGLSLGNLSFISKAQGLGISSAASAAMTAMNPHEINQMARLAKSGNLKGAYELAKNRGLQDELFVMEPGGTPQLKSPDILDKLAGAKLSQALVNFGGITGAMMEPEKLQDVYRRKKRGDKITEAESKFLDESTKTWSMMLPGGLAEFKTFMETGRLSETGAGGGIGEETHKKTGGDAKSTVEAGKISAEAGAKEVDAGFKKMEKYFGDFGQYVQTLKTAISTTDFATYVDSVRESAASASGLSSSMDKLKDSVDELTRTMGGKTPETSTKTPVRSTDSLSHNNPTVKNNGFIDFINKI